MPARDTKRVLLEVAVGSAEDALTAAAAGADRLELNAALALGGLTPSLGTLIEVKRVIEVPVVVLVRPRPGGFAYSDAEFRVMQRDVELALERGADGIAFGVLGEDGRVDRDRVRQLVEQLGGRPVVFHRAFDVVPDAGVALEELIGLGVRRVMTSGQEGTAVQGAGRIAELIRQAAGRIEVLPAAGINSRTVAELLARTGCDQVHASLRGKRWDNSTRARPQVRFGSVVALSEGEYEATEAQAVSELSALLQHVG